MKANYGVCRPIESRKKKNDNPVIDHNKLNSAILQDLLMTYINFLTENGAITSTLMIIKTGHFTPLVNLKCHK